MEIFRANLIALLRPCNSTFAGPETARTRGYNGEAIVAANVACVALVCVIVCLVCTAVHVLLFFYSRANAFSLLLTRNIFVLLQYCNCFFW